MFFPRKKKTTREPTLPPRYPELSPAPIPEIARRVRCKPLVREGQDSSDEESSEPSVHLGRRAPDWNALDRLRGFADVADLAATPTTTSLPPSAFTATLLLSTPTPTSM